jgi:hypothetical protein
MGVDETASAIAGGPESAYIGTPANANYSSSTGYLWCGGTTSAPGEGMFSDIPYSHAQPAILDVHTYPGIGPIPFPTNSDSADAVQSEGTIDFSDLVHYYQLLGLPSTTPFVVGETYSYTNNGSGGTCEANAPLTAGAETVAAYNNSMFPNQGVAVVFRPWMELEWPNGSCFTYTSPNNQSPNPQGAGPYTPTQP